MEIQETVLIIIVREEEEYEKALERIQMAIENLPKNRDK